MNQTRIPLSSASKTALFLCCAAEVIFIFSGSVGSVPWTRLLEDAVCRRRHNVDSSPAGDPGIALLLPAGAETHRSPLSQMLRTVIASEGFASEERCKGKDVQAEMAILLGTLGSFASIPALFLVMPYSILAKHIDRRLLLVVNMISIFCGSLFSTIVAMTPNVNLKVLWSASLFDLIGGGGPVFFMLLRSMIAEIVEADRLSSVLYILSGLDMLARLGGVVLGAWLLRFGVVAANLSSIALGSAMIPILGVIPQCVARVPMVPKSHHSLQQVIRKQSDPSFSLVPDSSSISITPSSQTSQIEIETEDPRDKICEREDPNHRGSLQVGLCDMHLSNKFRTVVQLPFHNPLCSAFLIIMFFNSLAMDVRGQVRTWASKRYNWPIATVSYVLSAESIGGVIVLFALPLLDRARRTGSHSSRLGKETPILASKEKRKRELQVARASIAFGVAGAFVLALATNRASFVFGLVIMTGAIGFVDALRAYCTSFFATDEIQTLYAAVSVVETLGLTIGSPVWGWIFARAYRGGSDWLGAPFGVCMLLLSCTLGLTWRLKSK